MPTFELVVVVTTDGLKTIVRNTQTCDRIDQAITLARDELKALHPRSSLWFVDCGIDGVFSGTPDDFIELMLAVEKMV